jgi:hypothetical protein
MSQENVEPAHRAYAALNDAYESEDVHTYLPTVEEMWDLEPGALRSDPILPVQSGHWAAELD